MKKGVRISLIVQEGTLKSTFPGCLVERTREEQLVWIHTLSPTPISATYRVLLIYQLTKGVKVFVKDPTLKLAEGKLTLPHVYSTPLQRLCLYYPGFREWDTGMLYTRTIIPWASEWLFHYESWVVTGNWHGGGIDHDAEGQAKIELRTEIHDESC